MRLWWLSFFFLSSCQSPRLPSSEALDGDFAPEVTRLSWIQNELSRKSVDLYLNKKQIQRASTAREETLRKQRLVENERLQSDIRSLEAEEQKTKLELGSQSGFRPKVIESLKVKDWRYQDQNFILRDLGNYSLGVDQRPTRTHILQDRHTKRMRLHLINQVFSQDRAKAQKPPPNVRGPEDSWQNSKSIEAEIRCDAPFSLFRSLAKERSFGAGATAKLNWYDSQGTAQKVYLELSDDLKECFIYLKMPNEKKPTAAIRFASETSLLKSEDRISNLTQACLLPSGKSLPGPERFFLSSQFDGFTCPQAWDEVTSLADSVDGINAKVKALLGRELSAKELETQDPFFPLDFSKAPKLDQIFISYLVYRADFYGTLLARLLEFHAQRGASVKIINSKVIEFHKDAKLLLGLAAKYPNFEVQNYVYDSPFEGLTGDHIHQLHRTNHIKMFLTRSSVDPSANLVIFGGRNIHDGFVFKKLLPRKKFPDMVDYGYDENWSPWRDYEVLFRGAQGTEQMAALYLSFWNRDPGFSLLRASTVVVPSEKEADSSYFSKDVLLTRSFASIPYRDERMLMDMFASLLDHAEKSIVMSTPYFRPTPRLTEALNRAVDRNVSVTLVTRLDLKGDTADFIVSDANKQSVNKFIGKIKMYEYTEPGVILHSKIFLIDDRLSLVGSVNLNKRSFLHDLENGVLVYSHKYNSQMRALLNTYIKGDSQTPAAREITQEQQRKILPRLILKIFDSWF